MALITYSDIIELREKISSSKLSFFLGKLSFSSKKRITAHWNAGELAPTNWWNIPLIRKRWNEKITGFENKSYIEYIVEKYLANKSDLSMLSIGCGTGTQEIDFLKTEKFLHIEAIDIASVNIEVAKKRNTNKALHFIHSSFEQFTPSQQYDVILFHSSLHHLKNINLVLQRVKTLLKENGLLIIHEYTGPNRINWNKSQLNLANKLLHTLPPDKRRYPSEKIKKKQTAPGKMRMIISDPSEAVESESILLTLKKHFNTLELKGYGGNILVPLLKGISHHFIADTPENTLFLNDFFREEDSFLKDNTDDYYFGVFQ